MTSVNSGEPREDISNDVTDLNQDFQNKCTMDTENCVEDEKPAEHEKVLIEKDGKFELVNESELKSNSQDGAINNDVRIPSDCFQDKKKDTNRDTSIRHQRSKTVELGRPKSIHQNDMHTHRPMSMKSITAHIRQPNPEYSHVKSRYAMSEQQMEMKRKREALIARRKREEEARRAEDMEEQRQEADKAFEAWLKQKQHNIKHALRQESCRSEPERPSQEEIDNVFKGWLAKKSHQMKREHLLELAKQEEEAGCYVVRNQHLCDEAYRRWKRKKLQEKSKEQFHQKYRRRTSK